MSDTDVFGVPTPTTAQTPPVLAAGGMPAPGASIANVAAPTVAQDSDVIEPTWVDAVRAAVRSYQGDPYNLNTAIMMLRREYLAKRYGKDIEQAK